MEEINDNNYDNDNNYNNDTNYINDNNDNDHSNNNYMYFVHKEEVRSKISIRVLTTSN